MKIVLLLTNINQNIVRCLPYNEQGGYRKSIEKRSYLKQNVKYELRSVIKKEIGMFTIRIYSLPYRHFSPISN